MVLVLLDPTTDPVSLDSLSSLCLRKQMERLKHFQRSFIRIQDSEDAEVIPSSSNNAVTIYIFSRVKALGGQGLYLIPPCIPS